VRISHKKQKSSKHLYINILNSKVTGLSDNTAVEKDKDNAKKVTMATTEVTEKTNHHFDLYNLAA
jgi:hypothetical protein